MRKLLEFLQYVQNVAFDQKLDEHILKANLLHGFLERRVRQHNIVAITIDKQNILILDLRMTACYTSIF